jgi:hypothetical protein
MARIAGVATIVAPVAKRAARSWSKSSSTSTACPRR